VYLDNQARTLFFLKIFGLICLLAFFITFIVQLVYYEDEGSVNDVLLCKKPMFVTTGVISVLISAIFIYVCSIVDKNIKIKIQEMRERS
jgi:hypothetical protein